MWVKKKIYIKKKIKDLLFKTFYLGINSVDGKKSEAWRRNGNGWRSFRAYVKNKVSVYAPLVAEGFKHILLGTLGS